MIRTSFLNKWICFCFVCVCIFSLSDRCILCILIYINLFRVLQLLKKVADSFLFLLKKCLYEISFTRIQEQVGRKRSTVFFSPKKWHLTNYFVDYFTSYSQSLFMFCIEMKIYYHQQRHSWTHFDYYGGMKQTKNQI